MTETSDSKPVGRKFDHDKLPYHLVDPDAEAEMVAVLGFGAEKYAPGNWAFVEEAEDRYFSAIRRHLYERKKGNVLDSEHGLLALASVACSAHFLLALELRKRPELVASLPERYKRSLQIARSLKEKNGEAKIPFPDLADAIVHKTLPPGTLPFYYSIRDTNRDRVLEANRATSLSETAMFLLDAFTVHGITKPGAVDVLVMYTDPAGKTVDISERFRVEKLLELRAEKVARLRSPKRKAKARRKTSGRKR